MPDYSQGKIYKIISSKTNKVYIGSTTQKYLCDRMSSHRYDYRQWKKGKDKYYCSSSEIMKYSDAKIILIENWSCPSKDSLFAREQQWIDQTENCCNIFDVVPKLLCHWCGHTFGESYTLNRHKQSIKHQLVKNQQNEFIDSLK